MPPMPLVYPLAHNSDNLLLNSKSMHVETTNINYTPSQTQLLNKIKFDSDNYVFSRAPELLNRIYPDSDLFEELNNNYNSIHQNPDNIPIPTVKFQPGYFVVYNSFQKRSTSHRYPTYVLDPSGNKVYFNCSRCHHSLTRDEISNLQKNCNSCQNLENNKHHGDLSQKSFTRLTTALDWLFLLSKPKRCYNEYTQKWFTFKVAMLTLSLPCQQLHDDLYVKNIMLDSFLHVLRKKHNLNNYIWRAEKKLNGTIHFHIILDIYVHHQEYNRIWNKILQKHGYIDQYRENQQNFHGNSFRYRKNLDSDIDPTTGHKQRRWTYSQQLQAYKKGVATNWSQPSGTSDIHSLKNITNTRNYMGKYVSKKIDIEKGINFHKKAIAQVKLSPYASPGILPHLEADIKSSLTVQGNIWYLSVSLSKMKGCKTEISLDLSDEIETLANSSPRNVHRTDHCTVFYFKMRDIASSNFPTINNFLRTEITEIRNKYYPPGDTSYSILGSPLKIFDKKIN